MAGSGRKPEVVSLTSGRGADGHAAMVARAKALIPTLRERASMTEQLRRLPPETERDLHDAGLFRIVQPKRVGGSELDYVALVDCADALGQADASVAWNFANLASHHWMLGMFDPRAQDAVWKKDADALVASSFIFTAGRARKVDGGYVVNGRKFFVSLAGCAPYYATPAIRLGDEPWIERTLYLEIPKEAPGVSFPGEWDPMGMRATVSRDMLLQDVFVPDDAEVLPPGLFGAMYNAFPHLFLSFSATFLGLMQAAYDGALAYLTGRMPGAPIPHTEIAAKGHAIAEMLFAIESARALYYRAISEAQVDAPLEAVQRARAAHVTVQRAVVAVTQEAIRVCGGRAFLKRYPLERYARDARAAALMRPWTQEIAMQQAWEAALGLDGQRGAAAGA